MIPARRDSPPARRTGGREPHAVEPPARRAVLPAEGPRPAIGHMPFKGHRTCAELMPYWRKAQHIAEPESGFVAVEPRNRRLIEDDGKLVGRWR